VAEGRVRGAFRDIYLRSRVRDLLPSRLKVAIRAAWVALAHRIGYPISSPWLPRPPLRRGRAPLSLGRALLACDLNADYLDFWPSTQRAWREIVGVEPLLVLIASQDDVPQDLRTDPNVVTFDPLPGVHTAFQAQCIRLLYPAVVETNEAVIIADIDLYPLRASYFHDPLRLLDERFFVVYRDERLERKEIDMMFNAARPETWGEVFGISTEDDVRAELARWADGLEYDGRKAWPGWYTDQQTLYRKLLSWPARGERLWLLDDQYCGFRRLNRDKLVDEDGLEPWRIAGIRRNEYTDYNCLVPYREHAETNDRVLALGLQAADAGRQ
jgi:hypothetical protein